MSQKPDPQIAKCPPPCPLCKKQGAAKYAPFCSAGCKDRDLLQWLGDGYRIPAPIALSDEDDYPSEPHGFEG
ncbi:MAG: DNA gyrase inhibitor YacG [Sphingorhabdus sp.]